MSIPYYVNENKSDMRGIKSGWYAMDDGGKFSSGPFLNRDDCLSKGTQAPNDSTPVGVTPRPK